MLDDAYIDTINDAKILIKEANSLSNLGHSDKEIAKRLTKKRLLELYLRLSTVPVGNQTGLMLLQNIRLYESSYTRTLSLKRGLFT
jgi:hypothetical protein